jgi:hypothetical protein
MAVDVGERLLDDAKNRELQALLDPAELIGDFDMHRDSSTLGEKFGVGTQRGNQAGLFQHGRVQNGRDQADLANGVTGQSGRGLHQLVNFAVAPGHRATDLAKSHF